MAKRKGSSTSHPERGARRPKKDARRRSPRSAAGDEKEFCQLRCEVYPLLWELDELSKKQRKLKQELKNEKLKVECSMLRHNLQRPGLSREARRLIEDKERWNQMERERRAKELKRKLEEQLRPLRREEEQLQRKLLPKSNRLKELCSPREAENTQRLLSMLPPEVWEKILLDHLENDLFPLALSCRYFRQVQKELVARARQSGSESEKSRLALNTNLRQRLADGQKVSADYLRFCSKEKAPVETTYGVPNDWNLIKANYIRYLAAFHGHLPLLRELLAGSKGIDSGMISEAAMGGQLETLKWLKTQKGFKLGGMIFTVGSVGGHLETLKWLRSEGCPWDEHACSNAAKGGHLEVLKWLRSEGCPWDAWTCSGAAKGGHLDVLEYAHENGCPWNEDTCEMAADCGHLDVLKFAHENGCPWDEGACRLAAMNGHLDVLKYLHEKGCPWNEDTCRYAAATGHLNVLKYLHENGCPWDKVTCEEAAAGGHFNVLKYAHENGCPWNEVTCEAAASGDQLDVLKYLHENGCPWHEGTCEMAAEVGNLDMVKYAHENGCPWDEMAYSNAAEFGNLDVLRYLHDNGCPRDEMVFGIASESVREWLNENVFRLLDEYDDDSDE